MLPARHRMRSAAQFAEAIRRGRTAGRRDLVVHLHVPAGSAASCAAAGPAAIAGLVVGRSVGQSVVRHRVARRLRAQLATRLPLLPSGSAVVVRARPSAAAASSAALGQQLESALRSLTVSTVPPVHRG